MRKINIVPYEAVPLGMKDPVTVDVFGTIEEILSAGKFSPKALLDRMDLLAKFRKYKGQAVLYIEEADHKLLTDTMETIEGFNTVHEEFIRRVLGAPEHRVAGNQPAESTDNLIAFPPKGDSPEGGTVS